MRRPLSSLTTIQHPHFICVNVGEQRKQPPISSIDQLTVLATENMVSYGRSSAGVLASFSLRLILSAWLRYKRRPLLESRITVSSSIAAIFSPPARRCPVAPLNGSSPRIVSLEADCLLLRLTLPHHPPMLPPSCLCVGILSSVAYPHITHAGTTYRCANTSVVGDTISLTLGLGSRYRKRRGIDYAL